MKAAEAKDRTWTFADGQKIQASVVKYGRKVVSFVRKDGQLYVNDKPFKDFSPLQQNILLNVVSELQNEEITKTRRPFQRTCSLTARTIRWSTPKRACWMQMADGSLLAVPFFMFSDKDLKVLQPGWQAWSAADKDEQRKADQEHMLRAEANEYQRNQNITHELQYLQFASQWFDLWQVNLQLPDGTATSVIIPARNSLQATNEAIARYPHSFANSVQVISRR